MIGQQVRRGARAPVDVSSYPVGATYELVGGWLDDLRLCLSRIEKENCWDARFVRRLLAQKKRGALRLTGTAAEKVKLLHMRFVGRHSGSDDSAKDA